MKSNLGKRDKKKKVVEGWKSQNKEKKEQAIPGTEIEYRILNTSIRKKCM